MKDTQYEWLKTQQYHEDDTGTQRVFTKDPENDFYLADLNQITHSVLKDPKAFRSQIQQRFDKTASALVFKAHDEVSHSTDEDFSKFLPGADILLKQQADPEVVASALLAPLMQRGAGDLGEIRRKYGDVVADLVTEVYSEAATETGPDRSPDGSLDRSLYRSESSPAEKSPIKTSINETDRSQKYLNVDRLLFSLSGDIRVAITRLGLRMARLLQAEPPYDQRAVDTAKETMDLYVPLAGRLGMWRLRQQLEDICFRILEPKAYEELAHSVARHREQDAECLSIINEGVKKLLDNRNIQGRVTSRIKSLSSIHQKIKAKKAGVEEILDKLGVRIIVQTVHACYEVLGLLHTHFRPITGTFDDYIGTPKNNGYQSLHTCVYPVFGVFDKPVEFQIRTEFMHMEAEYGVAAHWRYKSRKNAMRESRRQLDWIRSLPQQHKESNSHEEFVDLLREQVFNEPLVIFTNGGRQVRMPKGATVSQFARQVLVTGGGPKDDSVQVSFKINGRPTTGDRVLKDGDTVEIVSVPKSKEPKSKEPKSKIANQESQNQ